MSNLYFFYTESVAVDTIHAVGCRVFALNCLRLLFSFFCIVASHTTWSVWARMRAWNARAADLSFQKPASWPTCFRSRSLQKHLTNRFGCKWNTNHIVNSILLPRTRRGECAGGINFIAIRWAMRPFNYIVLFINNQMDNVSRFLVCARLAQTHCSQWRQ